MKARISAVFSRPAIYALPALAAGVLLAPPAADAQGGAKSVLEEVLVTARRREENLQEVPDTIVALSAETIERANITMVRDVTARIPNVSIEESLSPTSTFLAVRGVASTRNGEPSVAMVVDGVQIGSSSEVSQAFHDVESIEVLKGPQGALYGRNAIGGAVLITTKKPTDELEARVMAGYGSGNMYEFSGAVSGPITNDLKFRVSGNFRDMEGTITNEWIRENADGANITSALNLASDEDSYADSELNKDIRARLLWDPLETTSFDLRVNYSDLEVGSYWYNPIFRLNDSTVRFPIGNDVNTIAHRDLINVALKIDHDIKWGTITSTTAWTSTEERYGIPYEGKGTSWMGDVDFTNQTFINRVLPSLSAADQAVLGGLFPNVGSHNFYDLENIMQEVRFTSNSDQRLRWVAGAFALFTDRKETIRADHVPPTASGPDARPLAARLPNGLPGYTDFATISGLLAETSNEQDNTAWAVFFSADYDLTDKLTLTAALRYDEDSREITRLDGPTVNTGGQGIGDFLFTFTPGTDCTVGVGGCVPRGFVEKKTWAAFQPKASLAYQLNDDALLYATYARGFRSGGFNATGATLADIYEDETLDNYELGAKTTWLDGRLRVNVAGFYQDYENAQIFEFDGAIFVQSLFNIPESEIYGFEMSFDWIATDSLSFSGGFGILESEIKEFNPFVRDQIQNFLEATITSNPALAPDAQAEFASNFQGNKLPKFPHQTVNLSMLHDMPVSIFGNSRLITRVDYRGFNDRYWWVDNTDKQGFEHLVDGSIALQLSSNWELAFWCKNCTDADYLLSFEPVEMTLFGGPSKDIEYVARGLTYGAQIKYQF